MGCFFHFSSFWMRIHSKLNKFRIKNTCKLDCYIVSDLRFYLKYKVFCQKPAHSYLTKWLCWAAFFQMFIVLWMYNLALLVKSLFEWSLLKYPYIRCRGFCSIFTQGPPLIYLIIEKWTRLRYLQRNDYFSLKLQTNIWIKEKYRFKELEKSTACIKKQ